jgi:hypothetical protein
VREDLGRDRAAELLVDVACARAAGAPARSRERRSAAVGCACSPRVCVARAARERGEGGGGEQWGEESIGKGHGLRAQRGAPSAASSETTSAISAAARSSVLAFFSCTIREASRNVSAIRPAVRAPRPPSNGTGRKIPETSTMSPAEQARVVSP